MNARQLFILTYDKAVEFGLKAKNPNKAPRDENKSPGNSNVVIRDFLSSDEGAPFFAFIQPSEPEGGVYCDISFVVFPDSIENTSHAIVALVVGTGGFINDYNIASRPGLRREFLKLYRPAEPDKYDFFIKSSFVDIDSVNSKLMEISKEIPQFKSTVEKYGKFILAGALISIDNEENLNHDLANWIALYANRRGFATNNAQKNSLNNQLKRLTKKDLTSIETEVYDLLMSDRFVVLQGAPGSGKTFTALKVAKKFDEKLFDQFHAETSFSDFVWGIQPAIGSENSIGGFENKPGILYTAIKKAKENPSKKVLLIIDEINRANLSNVLGPVFYLFEKNTGERAVKIKIGDKEIDELPSNLYVVATMNTADRSLAGVDFALRRRFIWYTVEPREITEQLPQGKVFNSQLFNRIADIFNEYASDDERNLQPGQAYFIVDEFNKDKSTKQRLIYELRPLIKEYLNEGYLLNAREEFENFFLETTNSPLFE